MQATKTFRNSPLQSWEGEDEEEVRGVGGGGGRQGKQPSSYKLKSQNSITFP